MKVPDNLFRGGFYCAGAERVRPYPAQVEICRNWLRTYAGVWRSFTYGSYGLKHDVERTFDNHVSINNGAFIQAAIELGYEWKRDGDSPNALFKLAYSSFIRRCCAPQEKCVCGHFDVSLVKRHNKQRAYFRRSRFTPSQALELSDNAGRLARVGEAVPPDHYRFGHAAVLQPRVAMSDMSAEIHS